MTMGSDTIRLTTAFMNLYKLIQQSDYSDIKSSTASPLKGLAIPLRGSVLMQSGFRFPQHCCRVVAFSKYLLDLGLGFSFAALHLYAINLLRNQVFHLTSGYLNYCIGVFADSCQAINQRRRMHLVADRVLRERCFPGAFYFFVGGSNSYFKIGNPRLVVCGFDTFHHGTMGSLHSAFLGRETIEVGRFVCKSRGTDLTTLFIKTSSLHAETTFLQPSLHLRIRS